MGTMDQELEALPTVVKPARVAVELAKSEALSEAAAALTYTMTTTFVDGTDGTGTVQFVFLDSDGEALTSPLVGRFYFSDVATGLSSDAVGTSVAVLTNGSIDVGTALTSYDYITTATGLLGLTIGNGAADSIWCIFTQPNGTMLISDEMAITGP